MAVFPRHWKTIKLIVCTPVKEERSVGGSLDHQLMSTEETLTSCRESARLQITGAVSCVIWARGTPAVNLRPATLLPRVPITVTTKRRTLPSPACLQHSNRLTEVFQERNEETLGTPVRHCYHHPSAHWSTITIESELDVVTNEVPARMNCRQAWWQKSLC